MEKAGFKAPEPKKEVWEQFLENVPKSLAAPLVENNVIGVILLALAFGLSLRKAKDRPIGTVTDLVDVAMETMLGILHAVIQIVPLGVFGIVASIVGKNGLTPFLSLGYFVIAVLIALLLQACLVPSRESGSAPGFALSRYSRAVAMHSSWHSRQPLPPQRCP